VAPVKLEPAGDGPHGNSAAFFGDCRREEAWRQGEVPLPEVLDAIRGDNWLYARGLRSGLGMASTLARDIKARIGEALTVDADEWREKVYARSAVFALKAYRGLTGPPIQSDA
jgi:hypothetical protein